MTIDPSPRAAPDAHRRRASYLYGLVVSGAVLAAASDTYRISRIAIALLGTLVIYWASETYVHWIAAREQLRRNLTRDERRLLVLDGWPLVTAAINGASERAGSCLDRLLIACTRTGSVGSFSASSPSTSVAAGERR